MQGRRPHCVSVRLCFVIVRRSWARTIVRTHMYMGERKCNAFSCQSPALACVRACLRSILLTRKMSFLCACTDKLHLGDVVVTQPTIGSNVEHITHKNIHFEAWDLGGQVRALVFDSSRAWEGPARPCRGILGPCQGLPRPGNPRPWEGPAMTEICRVGCACNECDARYLAIAHRFLVDTKWTMRAMQILGAVEIS